MLRLIDLSGPKRQVAWEEAATLPTEGDAFLEEILRAEGPSWWRTRAPIRAQTRRRWLG